MCACSVHKQQRNTVEGDITGELGFENITREFYESALMVVRASRMRYSQYLEDVFRIDPG